MKHFDIKNRMESYHDHNKVRQIPRLIHMLQHGLSVAVVSDAGTPAISDPAFRLVREAIALAIPVIAVPGPTAAITALSVSGLPTDRFVFEGFLPVKKGRRTRLLSLKEESRTLILYEAPHRLLRTLKDLYDVLGDRSIAVCRELTKKFEEITRGTITTVLEQFSRKAIKGELVLVVEGKTRAHDKKARHPS